MTTIAFDGKTLAADRQASAGDVARRLAFGKVWRVRMGGRDLMFAACGDLQDAVAFMRWTRREVEQPEVGENFLALCIDEHGRVWQIEEKLHWFRLPNGPVAIGSGRDIALGALHAGASAAEAVRIACRLDIYSGFGVQTLTRQPMKPVPMKPAKKPGKRGKKGC